MSTTLSFLRLSPPPLHHHHPKPTLHPLKLSLPKLPPNLKTKRTKISSSYGYTPAVPVTDRLISSASYFLPLFNSLQYSRFLFSKFPILSIPFQPLLPLLSVYHSFPYASFVTFFAFYLGVVRNPALSRYVRFNALQALVLDVLLVVPVLIQKIISPTGRVAAKVMGWGYSGIFVFVVGCFVYGLVSSVLGKTPYLPVVAEAAKRQLSD